MRNRDLTVGMLEILTPLTPKFYIELPQDLVSIIGWLVFFVILVILAVRLRDQEFKLDRRSLVWLALLSLLILVFTPFLGISLDIGSPLPVPGRPEEPHLPHLMFLAAVPWLVAGGILGVLPAVLLAGLSGVLIAYLDTHSIFTPLIFIATALFFSRFTRQRYRTWLFRILRFPLASGLLALLLVAPISFCLLVLSVPGEAVIRIEYAISQFPGTMAALGGMTLIGSLVCVVVRWLVPEDWGDQGDLLPAPGETSMRFRLFAIAGPVLLVLLISLLISDWIIAENAARRIMVGRLTSTAQVTAEGIPYFIETGQNQILQIADQLGMTESAPEEIDAILDRSIRTVPYFEQLVFLDTQGQLIDSYPDVTMAELYPSPVELLGIDLALDQVRIQVYPVPPAPDGESARLSFFATVFDQTQNVLGVVWGRASLARNPFSQPFVDALAGIADLGGTGQIIGDEGLVLYHTIPQRVMRIYEGEQYQTPTYFEGTAPDGTRSIQFYQPVVGRLWGILITMPASAVQDIAWDTAFPLLLVVFIAFIVIYLTMLVGLNQVVKGVQQVSKAAEKISKGDFNIEMPKAGHFGEIGQLKRTFNKMVGLLKNRLKAQNSLLMVSQKIGGNQRLQDALEVILRTALEQGISSGRIVLSQPNTEKPTDVAYLRFGIGSLSRKFATFDNQILALTQSRGPLVMSDIHIIKALKISDDTPHPDSLISMPMAYDGVFYGVLWITFQDRKWFEEEEVRFFEDLAQKAALAVVTSQAIQDALAQKDRCEAVLDTLPDPVLIFDSYQRLVYNNAAADELPGIGGEQFQGRHFPTIFRDENLLGLVENARKQIQTQEVELNNGKTYHALVSAIKTGKQQTGLVCIFKDITRYKELDLLKSEFVATVSHELRSPLTLITGYAQILKLIGNMNDQQETYVGHIIQGVEEMKSLVKNLLDLGRLEAGDALEISKSAAGDIVHQVVGSLEVHAQQKNIALNVAIPSEPIFLEADITFLTQAVKNLVENAIKFTPMGGKVDIGVRSKDQQVIFAVRDNGIGIAPLDQRRLFEKFYRPGVQNQKGSGLGLAIVKSIVERHGGKVWFESQLGKGSSFYIRVPMRQEKQS